VVVLLLWIPLRERPGLGTLMFALLIGPSVALGLAAAGRVGQAPGPGHAGVPDEDFPELDA
jgi:hypothetical protein